MDRLIKIGTQPLLESLAGTPSDVDKLRRLGCRQAVEMGPARAGRLVKILTQPLLESLAATPCDVAKLRRSGWCRRPKLALLNAIICRI
jgi:hypothetical protein